MKKFPVKAVFLILALAAILILMLTSTRIASVDAAGQTAVHKSFFQQFIIAGGPIVWFILLPMSLITVYLAAEYSLTIRRKKLLPAGTADQILTAIRKSNPNPLKADFTKNDDMLSIAITRTLTQGKGDWFRMRSVVAESLQDQAWQLMRKIEWINLIGNVSPMVGLFGTVFGMIKMFDAIVYAGGQPQPAQLAGGISVALVTTFWGLFIAIPAITIYGIFRNRIETLVSDAVVEAEDIMYKIRLSLKKAAQSQAGDSRQQDKIC